MSNESRLMALLEEGNPATEVGMRDWTEVDAASYLAALEPRSSDMTQLRTKSKNPTGIRRTGMVALAAAFALVVIVGIGFAFFDRNDDGDLTSPPTFVEVAESSGLDEADLVGRWTRDNALIHFNEDGTYTVELLNFSLRETVDTGTWRFDGVEFVWTTAQDSPTCALAVGRYEVLLGDNGKITMTAIGQDACADRAASIDGSPLTRMG